MLDIAGLATQNLRTSFNCFKQLGLAYMSCVFKTFSWAVFSAPHYKSGQYFDICPTITLLHLPDNLTTHFRFLD